MKQTLLLVIILTILSFQMQAQFSVPASVNGSAFSIIPDSSSNLPHAMEGVPYQSTIQFKVPISIHYNIGGIPFTVIINDITLHPVIGLSSIPSTSQFSFVTTPVGGVFPSGQAGNIQFFGTPALGSGDSVYNLKVKITLRGHIQGSSQIINIDSTINSYRIAVDENSNVPSVNKNRFDMAQNYPNPFKTKTSISFNVPNRTEAEFLVYNLVGSVLYKKTIDAKVGVNILNFDASGFEPGVYFYSISNGSAVLTKRLIIDKN